MHKSGLDLDVPRGGRSEDAYDCACTSLVLMKAGSLRSTEWLEDTPHLTPARHAVTLHRISGQLHRLAERACNEDLTCPECGGTGDGRIFSCPSCENRWFSGIHHGSRVNISGEQWPDCPECGESANAASPVETCRACAGDGRTIGKRLERLHQQARDIAEHYGLRCYFQTDPRGCSLYLIDPAVIPSESALRSTDYLINHGELSSDPLLATLQARWIDSNYTRGHAVGRFGR